MSPATMNTLISTLAEGFLLFNFAIFMLLLIQGISRGGKR